MTDSAPGYNRFQDAVRAIVPGLLQIFGLIGFAVTFAFWLIANRQEPELMGICVVVATGGFLYQSVLERLGLQAPPQPPVQPPAVPPAPPPPAPSPWGQGTNS